jgi:hypothetical protein
MFLHLYFELHFSFFKYLSSISDPGIFKLNIIQQVKRSQAAARFEPLITGF